MISITWTRFLMIKISFSLLKWSPEKWSHTNEPELFVLWPQRHEKYISVSIVNFICETLVKDSPNNLSKIQFISLNEKPFTSPVISWRCASWFHTRTRQTQTVAGAAGFRVVVRCAPVAAGLGWRLTIAVRTCGVYGVKQGKSFQQTSPSADPLPAERVKWPLVHVSLGLQCWPCVLRLTLMCSEPWPCLCWSSHLMWDVLK